MENFHKLISRGTKTIYLILSTFLAILCVQNLIYKVLLKVINEHFYYHYFKVAFLVVKAKIVLR